MMGSQEFDAQTKRRKVAGRARSSSYVEGVFGKPKRDFDMVHTPEWMHNYPSKVRFRTNQKRNSNQN